jgi:hypothetical protein
MQTLPVGEVWIVWRASGYKDLRGF